MKETFTLEEVQNAINITAIVAREVGHPRDAAEYLHNNVPKELHSSIMAALLGVALAPSVLGAESGFEKAQEKESKCSCGPKCTCKEDEEDLSEEDLVKSLLRSIIRGF